MKNKSLEAGTPEYALEVNRIFVEIEKTQPKNGDEIFVFFPHEWSTGPLDEILNDIEQRFAISHRFFDVSPRFEDEFRVEIVRLEDLKRGDRARRAEPIATKILCALISQREAHDTVSYPLVNALIKDAVAMAYGLIDTIDQDVPPLLR